jgi:hypothetical protein
MPGLAVHPRLHGQIRSRPGAVERGMRNRAERRQLSLGVGRLAAVADVHGQISCAVGASDYPGRGEQSIRKTRRMLGVVLEDVSRARHWPLNHAAVHVRGCCMQRKLELGHDAKVAAAAADCPEEIGVFVRADTPDRSIRSHDLRGHEIVDRKPKFTTESPVAAAEREPAQARVRDDAPGRDEVVRQRRDVEVVDQRAAAYAGPARDGIDEDAFEVRQIEH